ncbi:engB [Symbiodinium microadriaticum]|nr:engB [Symbiodinium microadriaticum]
MSHFGSGNSIGAWNDEPKMVNRWNTLIRLVAKRRRMQDVFQVYDAMRALWVRADHGTTEFIARAAVATVDLSGLVDSFHTMPPARYPEVVFVGWSNVGKSSLINSLLHRTAVAPVSTMPGKTTQFHFYTINEHNAAFPKMTLVDVPGIGEAMADEVQTRHWRRTLDLYLKERGPTLRQVFHLISCEVLLRRQRPSPLDISVMEMCLHHRSKFNLDYTLVITKIDLIRSKKDAETVYENLCKVVRRLRLGSAKIVPASVRSTTGRVLLWKRLWRSVDPENSAHSSQDLSALRQEVERLVEAKDAEALIERAKEESGDGWECIVRGILALGRLHDAWQIIQAGPQRAQGLEEHETAEDAEEDMEMLKEGLLEAAEAGEEAEKDEDDEDAPEVSEDEAGDFFAIPEDLESEQMAAMQERAALAVGEAALAPKSEGGEPLLAPRDPALAEEVAMLLSKEHRGAAAELLMEQVVAIARLESLDSGPGQFPRSFGKLEALLKQAKEDAIFTPWSADRWNRLLRVVGSQANLNAVERVLDYMSQFQVTGDQETDAVMAELVVSSVDLGGQAPGPSELDPEPGSAPKARVFVKNLPGGSTDDSVRAIFEKFANVQGVKVLAPSMGRTTLAGYVTFASVDEATWVVENISDHPLDGLPEPVSISFAYEPDSVKGISKGCMGKGGMMMGKGMMKGGPYGKVGGYKGSYKGGPMDYKGGMGKGSGYDDYGDYGGYGGYGSYGGYSSYSDYSGGYGPKGAGMSGMKGPGMKGPMAKGGMGPMPGTMKGMSKGGGMAWGKGY